MVNRRRALINGVTTDGIALGPRPLRGAEGFTLTPTTLLRASLSQQVSKGVLPQEWGSETLRLAMAYIPAAALYVSSIHTYCTNCVCPCVYVHIMRVAAFRTREQKYFLYWGSSWLCYTGDSNDFIHNYLICVLELVLCCAAKIILCLVSRAKHRIYH